MYLCIEILGESPFHKFLLQSGWSGRDYHFHFNRHTNSHLRAYRTIEAYHAERIDLHKSANVWPLLFNWLPEEKIESHVFAEPVAKPATPASLHKQAALNNDNKGFKPRAR